MALEWLSDFFGNFDQAAQAQRQGPPTGTLRQMMGIDIDTPSTQPGNRPQFAGQSGGVGTRRPPTEPQPTNTAPQSNPGVNVPPLTNGGGLTGIGRGRRELPTNPLDVNMPNRSQRVDAFGNSMARADYYNDLRRRGIYGGTEAAPALQAAREAALQRGDISGFERSYQSPEMRQREGLIQSAMRQPAAAAGLLQAMMPGGAGGQQGFQNQLALARFGIEQGREARLQQQFQQQMTPFQKAYLDTAAMIQRSNPYGDPQEIHQQVMDFLQRAGIQAPEGQGGMGMGAGGGISGIDPNTAGFGGIQPGSTGGAIPTLPGIAPNAAPLSEEQMLQLNGINPRGAGIAPNMPGLTPEQMRQLELDNVMSRRRGIGGSTRYGTYA